MSKEDKSVVDAYVEGDSENFSQKVQDEVIKQTRKSALNINDDEDDGDSNEQ